VKKAILFSLLFPFFEFENQNGDCPRNPYIISTTNYYIFGGKEGAGSSSFCCKKGEEKGEAF